jgi:release factor glutamine methyltransferase
LEFLGWRQQLKGLGGESSTLDWLLDMAAGISRSRLQSLLLHPSGSVVLRRPRRDLERLWRQHLDEFVPLQYLVGRCFWRTFELEVGPAVLIPRPETEAMIDLALDLLREEAKDVGSASEGVPNPLWADLGTGSGCLAMGLAQAFPQSQGLAVDVSAEALDQAQRNLKRSGLEGRVRLLQGDWFQAVKPLWGLLSLVLANPPYIPSEEVHRLHPVVRNYEPLLALDGGEDGLTAIRSLAEQATRAMAPGGWLLLEHHHDQSEQVLALLAQHGLRDGRFHTDLEGHRRFASARVP